VRKGARRVNRKRGEKHRERKRTTQEGKKGEGGWGGGDEGSPATRKK